MTFVYDPEMKEAALRAAEKAGVPLRRGVYIAVTGPSYETPAEIRAFRALGADAVGMSTVPEVIAASHAGMKVLGFSLITNMAAGILKVRLSGDEVIAVGERQLLEVMEEGSVTVDGITKPVPNPFIVLATQNPVGSAGCAVSTRIPGGPLYDLSDHGISES